MATIEVTYLSSCPNTVKTSLQNYLSFLLQLPAVASLEGFWRLLFHDACSSRCQVLTDGCFAVTKKGVIQKVVVSFISKILGCQHTTEVFNKFSFRIEILAWQIEFTALNARNDQDCGSY